MRSKIPPLKKMEEQVLNISLLVFADEDIVEKCKELAHEGKNREIAVLMPGDPFCDHLYPKLKLQCHKLSTEVKVVHNACLFNAITNSGLQLYRFGKTVFGRSLEQMQSLLQIVQENLMEDLHTLIILDPRSDMFRAVTQTFATSSIPYTKGPYKESKIGSPMSYGLVLLIVDSYIQINGPFKFDEDFSSFNPSNVRAVVVTSKLHEMEESVLAYMTAPHLYSLEGRGVFHLIGLGLGQPEDITLQGKQAIEQAHQVYLEGYTSIMIGGKERLEQYFGKEIVVADREMVETATDKILKGLETGNVAFLVVGDPLGATTHTDLILRSATEASSVCIIHNASIMNAAAVSGLKPDNFGEVVSIPFWEDSWQPCSFYDKIYHNAERGLHTLCLLDIKVKEQSLENLMKGKKIYEKPRYMTVAQAANQLLKIIERRTTTQNVVNEDDSGLGETSVSKITDSIQSSIIKTLKVRSENEVVCLARIGTETEQIVVTSLSGAASLDLGGPLHSLIITGMVDVEEQMFLALYKEQN